MKTVFVELKIPMCVPTDSTYKPSHNNPSSHHVTITGVLFSRAAPPSVSTLHSCVLIDLTFTIYNNAPHLILEGSPIFVLLKKIR